MSASRVSAVFAAASFIALAGAAPATAEPQWGINGT
ncbi:MAG: hypothetical protein K0R33_2243, partial [Mycobacterium sp.]|nr:hypothetical protein [Mycobacterium sp.]